MAKIKKSKQPDKEIPPPKWMREVKGFLILTFSILIFISLISFGKGHESKNILGLIGHFFGWTLNALLGLSSYALTLYIGWAGWRMLFNKPINHPRIKGFMACLGAVSICMLLSVLEDRYSEIGSQVGAFFYSGLRIKKQYYHLGGAPSYYLYHDLPHLNLATILNTTGVIIVFTSTLLASLLYLSKFSLIHFLKSLPHLFKNSLKKDEEQDLPKENPSPFKAKEPLEKTQVPAPEKKEESDFLRFVKLRIPNVGGQESIAKNTALPTSAASQDLLAIQPETNLKFRPSISRKGQMDEPFNIMQQDKSLLAKKAEAELEKQEIKPLSPEISASPEKNSDGSKKRREDALKAQKVHNGDFTHFNLPSPQKLLSNAKKIDQSTLKQDLRRQAEVLEETLQSFSIEAKVGQINCGPTITSFEVHPAIGVKVQKIKALENDIALNMEAKSIRIIAPIPGKAAVGIEVPNPQPQEVGFKDMLLAYQQGQQKFHIPILLGKAVNGEYVMSDLTKMPHCIIAGATGSGKSVCINTIVMSILLNAKPDQIKLVMVDPKKVELTPYTKLPHMLAPVITEPQGACAALNWLVKEMENRYEILKQIGTRNIDAFNKRTINKELESSLDREIPEKMPYIVGIIDELADLMMVASHDIETPIARIAQMARAVGIHLILATQRPSREVITGLIKANFPTRISFKVASRVNSQIVLDEIGAESLLGNGDMLFLPPGSSQLIRAQGAFIRDEDINAVVQHICSQAPPNYVIESFDRMHLLADGEGSENTESSGDALYEQAKDIVLGTGNASTTFLQRKLKIGYARAASLMDELEQRGIVGPAEGSKPRKILAKQSSALARDEEMDFQEDGE